MENPPGASQVTGLIRNESAFDFDSVTASVILYDDNHQIIGVNKTEARTVLAGEQRYFSVLWYSPISRDKLSSVEVQVDTNLLSDANFMQKYGVPEKFQEYPTPTK